MGQYERTLGHRQRSREVAKINFAGPRTPEHNRKIGLANKGKKRPDLKELDHRRSEAGLYDGPNNPNFGNDWTPEMRADASRKHHAYIERTPIEQRRLSAQTKAKLSAIRKQQWQDPEYVAKLIKAMALSPNKLEQRVIGLLQLQHTRVRIQWRFSNGRYARWSGTGFCEHQRQEKGTGDFG